MKKIIAIIIGAVIIGSVIWAFARKGKDSPYLTEAVTRGALLQSVSASGKVEATSDIQLSFEQQGQIASLAVAEGDRIAKDAVLVTLNQRDADASVANAAAAVAAAQAEYDQLIVGASAGEKRVAEVARDNAQESLVQTVARAAADRAKAEQSLAEARVTWEAARTNLTQDIDAKLAAAVSAANTAEKKAQGVRNILDELYAENYNFELFFTITNVEAQARAENAYEAVAASWQSFKTALAAFRAAPTEQQAASSFPLLEASLVPVRNAVHETSVALVDAQVSGSAPKTVATYRTDVAAAWTDINASIADLADARVSLANARANGTAAIEVKQAAMATAEQNMDTVQAVSAQSVAQADGARKQAQADYDKLTAPPTAEERALRRARVDEALAKLLTAETLRARTALTAPIDGVVTKVNVKAGETVTPGETIVRLFAANAFEISVQVPEADIPKVNEGDAVRITLDAYGDDQEFSGEVHFVNPAETLIDDVVYYDVTIFFSDTPPEVKPGMSADVTINTDRRNESLSIPLRAVKEKNGVQYVDVLNDKATAEKSITLGMRADGGWVEILEGLEEGEMVVVGMKKK